MKKFYNMVLLSLLLGFAGSNAFAQTNTPSGTAGSTVNSSTYPQSGLGGGGPADTTIPSGIPSTGMGGLSRLCPEQSSKLISA